MCKHFVFIYNTHPNFFKDAYGSCVLRGTLTQVQMFAVIIVCRLSRIITRRLSWGAGEWD